MSESSCTGLCEPPDRVVFAEARQRFEAEAVHGTCDTGRYRMPYFSWGDGPPLVFIHGLSDGSRSFLQPMALLSGRFRCIGYDLPTGVGDGARLGRYTHADLVADLFALLDHLGIDRSYVVASSFGSTIAQVALRERPERLPRAALQGALAHRPLRRAESFLARLGRFLPGRMDHLPLRKKILLQTQGRYFAERGAEAWEWFLRCSGLPPIAAVARQALWLHQFDMRPLLAEIRQPVLLVCGDSDRVVPWAVTELLHRGLPNVGVAWIEGCGHVPSYSHPEAFAGILRRFLSPSPCAESGCSSTHEQAGGACHRS